MQARVGLDTHSADVVRGMGASQERLLANVPPTTDARATSSGAPCPTRSPPRRRVNIREL
jgi:hypothetical protein